jgi:hypothetical protein
MCRSCLGPRSVALAAAFVLAFTWSATAASSQPPVRLAAAFDRGAQLGDPTSLRLSVAVDPRRVARQIREIVVAYPAGLGLATSGLGLTACRPRTPDFERVLLRRVRIRCPANALVGRGTATAEVRTPVETIAATARIAIYSGPLTDAGELRLVYALHGVRPFGAAILLGGQATSARPPFEGAISILIPPIADMPPNTSVALTNASLGVGGPGIRYVRRGRGGLVRYRPDGLTVPPTCPRGGWPFRLRLTLEDGAVERAEARVRCPRRPQTRRAV